MYKFSFLIVLLTLTTFGCKEEMSFSGRFIDKGEVTYSVMDRIPELVLYYPLRVINVSNFFIVADFKGDKVFTAIDTSGVCFQFGNRGKGPDEFLDGYGLARITDSTFAVFDRMPGRVSLFGVKNDTVICYKKARMPATLNIFPFNDSIFVTNGNYPFTKNYGVVDLSLDTSYSYVDYPSSPNLKDTPQAKERIYYSHLVRKPNSNRFVAFKESHDIIDIMELKGDKLRLLDRKTFSHNEWRTTGGTVAPIARGTLNRFSAMITGSEKRIFACYEIPENQKLQWNILTFDWDGNPINRYHLPFVPYAICGKSDSEIFCIASIDDNYKLIKISLPE